MSVKASEKTPVKKELLESDDSGDTWVMIQPASYSMEMERGEYVKDRGMRMAVATNEVRSDQRVNQYLLFAAEIWISYPSNADIPCNIVVMRGDEEFRPFKRKREMNWNTFLTALNELDPNVVFEWHRKVVEVNPEWGRPF
jgi:hypothetical protein